MTMDLVTARAPRVLRRASSDPYGCPSGLPEDAHARTRRSVTLVRRGDGTRTDQEGVFTC